MKRRGSKSKRPQRNWIPQPQASKPRVFHPLGDPSCYKCSMPGIHRCQFPGCNLPMCSKHRIRKAGGSLCDAHQGAKLVQEASVPSPRFTNTQVSYVPSLTRDPDNA